MSHWQGRGHARKTQKAGAEVKVCSLCEATSAGARQDSTDRTPSLPDQLADTAAFLFGVKRAEIFGNSRVVRVSEARHALAWALRQNGWSLEAIGAFLNRDHTTIIYAVDAINRRMERVPRLAERLVALAANEPPPDWQARLIVIEDELTRLQARIKELETNG